MDLATFEWLLTTDGQQLLRQADLLCADGGSAIRVAEVLRRTATPEHAAAAMTQSTLRRTAEAKFGDLAASMYFTPDGLEQATRRRVAVHRASRLALAAPASVLDIGCGIGGDLVAFAGAGLTVAGVDLDPVRAAIAAENLRVLGLPGAVQVADGTTLDASGFGVVFLDPGRRNARGRVFDVDAYTPPWSFLVATLTRPACAKVAPGIPHELVPAGVEGEWVSDDGEVKEASLWSPHLASARRRATVIRAHGLATLTDEDDPGSAPVREVGRYLYEPDGAVIRAGLVTGAAAVVSGGLVDEHIAYVTGDTLVATPFARAYEVLEMLPYQEKQLRAALRARNIGRLTIKKRGVDVVPDALRKRLALTGSEEATIVLTRAAGKGTVLLVRPC